MRAVTITHYGPPEVLEIRSYPDPVPAEGQLSIRVKASGLNFADCLSRMGLYPGAPALPFIPGLECAGVVEGIGPGVDHSWIGRHVVAPVWFGGCAEVILAQPQDVIVIPEGRSFEEGAALCVTYLTAYHGLYYLANLHSGDQVLIHNAAGGVGTAAVQLALLRNAVVIGTASREKHEFLKSMGVHHVIDYRTEDFEAEVMRLTGGKGVRVVMDPIGGKNFEKSYRCLSLAGKLLLYGLSAAAPSAQANWLRAAYEYVTSPWFRSIRLMNDNKGVLGYHIGRLIPDRELLRTELEAISGLWTTGQIKPVIGKTFPCGKAAEAHRYMQERKAVGKIILTF